MWFFRLTFVNYFLFTNRLKSNIMLLKWYVKNNSFVKTVAASVKPFLTFTCTNMLTIQMYVSQSTCQLFVCTEKQKKKNIGLGSIVYIFFMYRPCTDNDQLRFDIVWWRVKFKWYWHHSYSTEKCRLWLNWGRARTTVLLLYCTPSCCW